MTTTLRRIGPGLYQTLDGRYNVERQDGQTECEHPLCDPLHQKWFTFDGTGRGSMHWVTYVSWHIWDNETDDYFGGGGVSIYESKRAAVSALTAAVSGAAS